MVAFNPSFNGVRALKPRIFSALWFVNTLLDCPPGFDLSNMIEGL